MNRTVTFNTGIYYSKKRFYTLVGFLSIVETCMDRVDDPPFGSQNQYVPWAFAPHEHGNLFPYNDTYYDKVLSRVQIAPDGEMFIQVETFNEWSEKAAKKLSRPGFISTLRLAADPNRLESYIEYFDDEARRYWRHACGSIQISCIRSTLCSLLSNVEANEHIGTPTADPFRQAAFINKRDELMKDARRWYDNGQLDKPKVLKHIKKEFEEMLQYLEPQND